ncbi:MAG: ABA4-like family protein [Pseudomonadota bacterium]
MDHELVFSLAGLLAMAGWAVLAVSPVLPAWSMRLAGEAIPALMSAVYLGLIAIFPAGSGGLMSFAEVSELFSHPQALMAGWIHFLAFDLFVGGWICRTARDEHIRFLLVLPCLPVTFLFGPAGYLCFQSVRGFSRQTRRESVA